MAVVSQPGNRTADVKQPGKLDETLGEFWVGNPWAIVLNDHNLSSFERNRLYLNVGGREFVEVSGISGADSDGDGRSAVAADFRNTGQPDLIVRQVGGGPLMLYENRMPARHYLTVSLRGTTSNKRGIGARLTAEVGGRVIVRELYPANTYKSQTPTQVLFGLADDTKVDKLTVRWPSGMEQVLTNMSADRHVVIEEGKEGAAAVETVTPGQTIRP
jgi:hypothetical protein